MLRARTERGTVRFGWNATKTALMEAAVESGRRVAPVDSQVVWKFVPLCLKLHLRTWSTHRNSAQRRLRVALPFENCGTSRVSPHVRQPCM